MEPLVDTIKRRSAQGCGPSIALLELLAAEARLVITRDNPGRLCELAVVAETGRRGMPENEVVAARRAYAASLGVTLSGPTKDSDKPAHISHAVDHSNHNPNARNRINLGNARAFRQNGRFYIFIPEPI